jgi:hypothetical protein
MDTYFYARGYYDGRHNGVFHQEFYDAVNQRGATLGHAYKTGYDAGVTDYSAFDAVNDEMYREET